jgi:hypothetical protein
MKSPRAKSAASVGPSASRSGRRVSSAARDAIQGALAGFGEVPHVLQGANLGLAETRRTLGEYLTIQQSTP